jgi:hypothetical protein
MHTFASLSSLRHSGLHPHSAPLLGTGYALGGVRERSMEKWHRIYVSGYLNISGRKYVTPISAISPPNEWGKDGVGVPSESLPIFALPPLAGGGSGWGISKPGE